MWLDPQRASAADRILEQLEDDRIADSEIVERRAFPHVTSMKEDLPAISPPDESVALADVEPDDPSAGRDATPFRRLHVTSAVQTAGDANRRHRSRQSGALWVALR